jgi:hypothetical protein
MKHRMIIVALVVGLAAFPAAAQTTFSDYEAGFKDFTDGVAQALPLNAAIGLNWSDAYIGNFPHFGIGLTAGAATVPWSSFEKVDDELGGQISGEYSDLKKWGVPIPAMAVEARMGGFILPFDVGVKLGFLPADSKALLPSGITADYLMYGFDVRYALLKGGGVLPMLSVGAGYTHLKGNITMKDAVAGETISNVGGYNVSVSNADASFDWEASVIDLKAQLSKKLLIITPYVGVGASLAVTSSTFGLESTVLVNGGAPTPAQIAAIEAATGESFDPSKGFFVGSDTDGWGFRAFGGTSVNLAFLKLDLTLMYNLIGGNFGGSISGRIQM